MSHHDKRSTLERIREVVYPHLRRPQVFTWSLIMSRVADIVNEDEKEISAFKTEVASLTTQLATAQANALDTTDIAALDAAATRQAADANASVTASGNVSATV